MLFSISFFQNSGMEYPKRIRKRIGKRLRELRIKAGYSSYRSFCYAHDLSVMQYWQMEAGEINFTFDKLAKILNIHNVKIKEFFAEL